MEACNLKNLVSHVFEGGFKDGVRNYQLECGLARAAELMEQAPRPQENHIFEVPKKLPFSTDRLREARSKERPGFEVLTELRNVRENFSQVEAILNQSEPSVGDSFVARGFLDKALVGIFKLRAHRSLPPSLENHFHELCDRVVQLNGAEAERAQFEMQGAEALEHP